MPRARSLSLLGCCDGAGSWRFNSLTPLQAALEEKGAIARAFCLLRSLSYQIPLSLPVSL